MELRLFKYILSIANNTNNLEYKLSIIEYIAREL